MKKFAIFLLLSLFSLPVWAQGPAYPYSTGLTWTLSTSGSIASQNVYRSPFTTTCGAFVKLTTTALSKTATAYTDANPPEGMYCYGVTATNISGTESGFSNISQANIGPPPPTGLNAVVATNTNGTHDVIYAWKNPNAKSTLLGNAVYCSPPYRTGSPAITVFPTTKIRVTSPSGTKTCTVTAFNLNGESGASNKVNVSVP